MGLHNKSDCSPWRYKAPEYGLSDPPPIFQSLKLTCEIAKTDRAALTLPLISILKYNLMRKAPEDTKIPDEPDTKM